IAPPEPHGPRWFRITARGTKGTGEQVESVDSLAVTLVSRALLELQAFINEPEGARDNTLSVGQAFTIRANLNNLGTAKTLDTARVRLELGQTQISVLDTLEKPIEVNGFVEWKARAPDSPAEGNITVRLIQRALDENTGLEAAIVSEISRFFVRTDSTGNLIVGRPEVTGPLGATDNILSSGQEFTVRTEIQWQGLRQVSAELLLPLGFFTEEARRNFAGPENRATPSWIVRAPEDSSVSLQEIRVRVEGKDANNDSLSFNVVSDPLEVQVVSKALLRLSAAITAPAAATDGIVSVNQQFEITGFVVNVGSAQVIGEDQIRLVLPEGYSTSDSLVKRTVNNQVSWRIKAKSTPSSGIETIKLILQKRPVDENTGREADVDVGEFAISIQTEPRLLLVWQQEARPAGPTASGEQSLPMMSLVLENLGSENSSAILLQALSFNVTEAGGQPISPADAIQRVQILSRNHQNRVLGELTEIPAANPMLVTLAQKDSILASVPDTIDVMVDLRNQVQVNSLQLGFTSSEAINAIDADSHERVQVVDKSGATGEQFVLQSETSVITESDYNNFYNYPNPFQPGQWPDAGTRFWYYLPSNSKVEFKILTLLGDLVYQKTFEANTPQGQAGGRIPGFNDIFWDGRNGDGKVVLNGVYIAILKTNAGVVTTKVAVTR
ncbi:MAG: T9SS C-terminal target domain-containing protein, partial [Calditrichaeota bacterium]